MSGWPAKDRALGASTAIAASQTDAPISFETPVTGDGALHLVVAVVGTATGGAVDIKLQTAIADTWVDSKATTLTGAGIAYIKLAVEIAADQTYLPLLNKVRVVATTGGGETLTVTNVWFLQAQ